jgi:hypothetical protein
MPTCVRVHTLSRTGRKVELQYYPSQDGATAAVLALLSAAATPQGSAHDNRHDTLMQQVRAGGGRGQEGEAVPLSRHPDAPAGVCLGVCKDTQLHTRHHLTASWHCARARHTAAGGSGITGRTTVYTGCAKRMCAWSATAGTAAPFGWCGGIAAAACPHRAS